MPLPRVRLLTTALLVSFSGTASSQPTADPVELPAEFEPLLAEATERIASDIAPGFSHQAGDAGSVKLVEIVKTLRAFGYGSRPEQTDVRGRRGGGGGRRGGGGGGATGRFARLDANQDGKLTGSEIGPRMQEDARAADGEVTLEEFEAAWAEMFGGGGRGRGGAGGGQGGRGRQGGSQGAGSRNRGRGRSAEPAIGDAQFVLLFDSDRDRNVTLDELAAAIRQDLVATVSAYTGLDANDSGSISAEENQPTDSAEENPAPLPFRLVDSNQDGTVSAAELVAYAQRRSRPRAIAIGVCLSIGKIAEDSVEPSALRDRLVSPSADSAAALERIGEKSIPRKDVYQTLVSVLAAEARAKATPRE